MRARPPTHHPANRADHKVSKEVLHDKIVVSVVSDAELSLQPSAKKDPMARDPSRLTYFGRYMGTKAELYGPLRPNELPSAPIEPDPPYPLEETMPVPTSPENGNAIGSPEAQRPIGFTAEVHSSAGTPPPHSPRSPISPVPNPPYPVEGLSRTPSIRMLEPLNAQPRNPQPLNPQPQNVQPLNPKNLRDGNPPSYEDVMANKTFYVTPEQK
uniref:Uncharacterized protein n=1 Tax=Lutzomyia longipalpis TaxID=7200 RepID=A0A1B0CQY2_LUTLO